MDSALLLTSNVIIVIFLYIVVRLIWQDGS